MGWRILGPSRHLQEISKPSALRFVSMSQLHGLLADGRIGGVEYRVLGSLSAVLDGVPRNLGGRRQRTVLAVLLAHANNVLAQDALIDAVWAGDPPDAARQTIHAYLSTLRKSLDGQIDREADGYVLRVDRFLLDALRFDDVVRNADTLAATSPYEALALLEEGLGLWTGPAYGDLADEPALMTEALRLEEARLTALEHRIELDVQLGHHDSAVQELEALTREHPFREHLRALQMLALYRSGRQGDALRAFQTTRTFLLEQLGIDPTTELQDLEDRILIQDPDLDWHPEHPANWEEVDRGARGYELRERLGESRFGTIHRGFQRSMGREVTVLKFETTVASKTLFVRRFDSEMQAVSRLEHPHISPLYDNWRDPDGAYLVTPHFRHGTLSGALSQGTWNLTSTLRLVDQVGSALDYAARAGFAHGSLGLENIFLDEDLNAYVSEFGMADLVDQRPKPTAAQDVHDLAGIAFTLLTGDENWQGAKISDVRGDLVALDNVFLRAGHKDPGSRYQKPEEFRRAIRQAAGVDVITTAGPLDATSRRNPYKGLRAFHEPDARDFYGREGAVEELLQVLALTGMVTVVGPSGSGKSSLVRAGLVPALRREEITGSDEWLITDMFPGTHPFEELEAALVRVAVDRPLDLFEDLRTDPRGLVRAAKQIQRSEAETLVLIVDQFEELFSLVSSDSSRIAFLDSILSAATDERSRVKVVLTLRADFFDQPLEYPDFAQVMRLGLVAISPPSEDGLARAIAQPARDAGLDLEPGLVTRIVDDVREEPGGLPLMQHALTELFAAREHDTLTLASYAATGGVIGALGSRAEEIYRQLSEEGKEATRQMFLRLVNVDESADDTRRRVRQVELNSVGIKPRVLEDVIQQFGSFRLLSFDRDGATRTPTVEVAHEALIREWDRLRAWIDERREDLLIHRRILVTTSDWQESGKDPSYLLRGSRLEQALLWQGRTDIAISEDEISLIEASIETENRELAERHMLEEKSTRRRKAVVGVLAGGLVVAGVLGAIALDRAQSERITAARAMARDLSASAMNAVDEDPELGVLLSLEAVDTTDQLGLEPVPESISAIRNTFDEMRVEMRIQGGYQSIAYSPDGSILVHDGAAESETGSFVIDAETGEPLGTLRDPEPVAGRPTHYQFSPNGRILAVARGSGIDLYETNDWNHLVSLRGPAGNYSPPSFSKDGLLVTAAIVSTDGSRALVWEVDSGQVFQTIPGSPGGARVLWAEFVPGSNTLLLAYGPTPGAGSDGSIELADLATTNSTSFDIAIEAIAVAASPDGRTVAIGDAAGSDVYMYRLQDGEQTGVMPHSDPPQTLAWSADSSMLAASGNDADVTIFDVTTRSIYLVLTGHESSVLGLSFSPEGSRIASASLDGAARVWNITPGGLAATKAVQIQGDVIGFLLNDGGTELYAVSRSEDSRLVKTASSEVIATYPTPYGVPAVYPIYGIMNDSFTLVSGGSVMGQQAVYRGSVLSRDATTVKVFDDCELPRQVSGDGELAVIDTQSLPRTADWCNETTQVAHSRVIHLSNGQTLVDFGSSAVVWALFSPATSESPYFAVVLGWTELEVYSLDGLLLGEATADELEIDGFLQMFTDPSGRYLGLATNGTDAVVVDMSLVRNGKSILDSVVFHVDAHKANTTTVLPTSDGRVLTAGKDKLYRMWDTATGELLWEIRPGNLTANASARITKDEQWLAYEDEDSTIKFVPLDSDIVVQNARAAVTRDFTDDECRRYLHTDGCET
jgi:DNA-binding SARP family transcriptional activator/WD40 repeat protein